MSRVPATLLYLTIYNPSLQPTGPIPEDDEDAEEQAHILFYTSRERAVSRDRMLRQVGLAKALVNFSEYAPSIKILLGEISSIHCAGCSTFRNPAATFIRSRNA